MLAAIRSRITLANTTLMLALVFAMGGGAYAAKRIIITSTNQISPKVLKKLQGKSGSAGREGKQGPAGKDGATGASGPEGKQGPAGSTGPEGKPGPQGQPGKNGAPGIEGKEGSPWVAGGTLPSGKTETGVWGFAGHDEGAIMVIFSFPIPLKEPPENVIVVKPEEEVEGCPGTASEPNAEPGNICIYAEILSTSTPMNVITSKTTGVTGLFSLEEIKGGVGTMDRGTWAVTAK